MKYLDIRLQFNSALGFLISTREITERSMNKSIPSFVLTGVRKEETPGTRIEKEGRMKIYSTLIFRWGAIPWSPINWFN